MNYEIKKRASYIKEDGKYSCILASFPLKTPYVLSFKTIKAFDTIYVLKEHDGIIGIGEVTALPGYSEDTIEKLWAIQQGLLSKSEPISLQSLSGGFKTVALETCRESFDRRLLYQKRDIIAKSAHLLDPPIGIDLDVIKFKIGKNLTADIEKIRNAQSYNYKFRADANQGYSYSEAREILAEVSGERAEYIEQPIRSENWNEMIALAHEYKDIRFLLDESVCSIADIDRVISTKIIDAIKLKLFKCGSIKNTLEMAEYALNRGLEVVLGNGVQTIVGAYYELLCYSELLAYTNFNKYSEINAPYKVSGFADMNKNIINIHSEQLRSFAESIIV